MSLILLNISYTTKAYPLQSASSILRSSLHWRLWWPERWQREISAPFWISDTWHVIERSWWLAWCCSQVDITEVYSSPPSSGSTTFPIQLIALYMLRPDKSSNVSCQLQKITGSKQTHNCGSWVGVVMLNRRVIRKSHSPLHDSSAVFPGMESISVEYSLHLSSKLLEHWLYAARYKKETESMRGDLLKMMILIVRDG
jgi:hypothetical protein